ncbi:nucleotidyltransferase domain-containing protein [Murimonas intestini]|uniref:Nucleotidyltransferase-like protein n=1 Tax=Murimonas intestini TaxID=1337051 RepID=A0AB73SY08_9FIRM|nr:nucleotidyltransferase domain-containing protein [Murimonas intestini]MCR1843105.1 nucleotidyltransferase domain-containing protein [Murimonas intestini]MCR1868414.1 nucleotidyltransferase domain-containing protein [Murimonas intestini]MCR1885858.1 nucleotidyltransferase domain-containing protein [Murimonas intestini]
MINSEINVIKEKLVLTIMLKQIYLFGSYAKDTYTEDSDYNFNLVVPDNAGD